MFTQVLVIVFLSGTIDAKTWDRARDCPFLTGHVCHCDEQILDCLNLRLTSVPSFLKRDWHYDVIHLTGNNISVIPADAFANINVSKILLDNNHITHIQQDAFKGIADIVEVLDLSNNMLDHLPAAISALTSLKSLDVTGNPIPGINYTGEVMRQIGDYLEDFRFGHPKLDEWPESLHHLPQLKNLSFTGGTMERLPAKAFHGFEWTLQRLSIRNSNLIAVPIAMQDLKNTVELHFDGNVRVKDAGILIPAFAGLVQSLDVLSLENNSLTEFPPVLLTLRQLSNLSLARNNLQFVSDAAVDVIGSNLTTINLQFCNLDRIPGALSKLTGVINLNFAFNNITTVEKNDLQGLRFLRQLDLSNNPLQYISNSAFKTLIAIRELLLKNVEMYFVPEALKNIPSLALLDMTSPAPLVECNCHLQWLYCHIQKHTSLTIRGECETIAEAIYNYAYNRIPNYCPHSC